MSIELIRKAYDHIDTYGTVYEANDRRRKIQQDLLDDLRNELNRPIEPVKRDRLPIRLTMIQHGERDSYEIALVSEHDARTCALSTGLNFEGSHFELSNWTTYFRERGCCVEIVDSANVYYDQGED
jgi:hypothetical protein